MLPKLCLVNVTCVNGRLGDSEVYSRVFLPQLLRQKISNNLSNDNIKTGVSTEMILQK